MADPTQPGSKIDPSLIDASCNIIIEDTLILALEPFLLLIQSGVQEGLMEGPLQS